MLVERFNLPSKTVDVGIATARPGYRVSRDGSARPGPAPLQTYIHITRASSVRTVQHVQTLMPDLTPRKMHKAEQFLEMPERESLSGGPLQRTPHNSNRSGAAGDAGCGEVGVANANGTTGCGESHSPEESFHAGSLTIPPSYSPLNEITKVRGTEWGRGRWRGRGRTRRETPRWEVSDRHGVYVNNSKRVTLLGFCRQTSASFIIYI